MLIFTAAWEWAVHSLVTLCALLAEGDHLIPKSMQRINVKHVTRKQRRELKDPEEATIIPLNMELDQAWMISIK